MVAVTAGVAVDILTVAVGNGVVVGSTLVRLQATTGNNKARPRRSLCHRDSRDMIWFLLLEVGLYDFNITKSVLNSNPPKDLDHLSLDAYAHLEKLR